MMFIGAIAAIIIGIIEIFEEEYFKGIVILLLGIIWINDYSRKLFSSKKKRPRDLEEDDSTQNN